MLHLLSASVLSLLVESALASFRAASPSQQLYHLCTSSVLGASVDDDDNDVQSLLSVTVVVGRMMCCIRLLLTTL
ncbi:unnamed protein product [Heligmosomoides polygyrus]|uniref:Secreted protein n=1 Tax=Heligmosomoides polygyrus TaxID=6339 RepID=A0A183FH22_HELPZ|nr:unnamed protein product [Heligmosomoides polygyrus]